MCHHDQALRERLAHRHDEEQELYERLAGKFDESDTADAREDQARNDAELREPIHGDDLPRPADEPDLPMAGDRW